MKRVVSISLGSSSRNKQVDFRLGDTLIRLERIGCDGDEQKAQALFAEMDGQVDAFGVGGVELYIRVEQRQYPLRAGLRLVKDVRRTPYTDGRGLKAVLESRIIQYAEPRLPRPITPRRAMMPLAVDRYAMAASLAQAGFDIVCCDLMFGLGLPIPIRSLAQLRRLAALLMPVLGFMPISLIYPTGQRQDENIPRYEKWFDYGPVIAGDFLYIRRHMPLNLEDKIIITNTTTATDVALLQERGVSHLVTSTPRLDGRSFGTNLLEAALIAYAGQGRPLTDAELLALIEELEITPNVQQL